MGHDIKVEFQSGGANAPAVYLLDGLRAQDDYNGWDINTAAFEWFDRSGVAVVMPVGGQSSFYTDWYSPSNFNSQAHTYKWETFLTRELPPLIDARFGGNGANAIGGLSMGGGAAFTLASRNPWLYRAVAGYSACPDNAQAMWPMIGSIALRGANPFNMWGAPGDPDWAAHDPSVNAEALRLVAVNVALARAAGATAPAISVVASDVLDGVDGDIDAVIANPPYLVDDSHRLYRDGGGPWGTALALRIADEALGRMGPGGRLVLYTGTPIVEGRNVLADTLETILRRRAASWQWQELDPDVFGEELERRPYRNVERLAVVGLTATVR
jgi:hypothetical protein